MTENIPRVLPLGLGVEIHRGKWPVPPIFYFLKQKGDVSLDEMYRVFNMGIGFILIVDKNGGEEVFKTLQGLGEEVYIIGQVIEGSGVRYVGEGE